MDFLKSIVPIIDSGSFVRQIDDSAQLQYLFELVSQQKVLTDDEARLKIYGNRRGNLAYKKLKQRLRDKLTEYVVQNGVTARSLDDYARLYRKCMNQVMAVKTLMMSYARTAGAKIGENLIRTTTNYEYTDLTLLLARELYSYYSAINYHPSKLKKFESIMNSAQELYNRELEVNKYYNELRIVFSTSRGSIKEKTLVKAIEYSDKIRPYLNSNNTSYQLILNIFEVIAMRYELEQDYYHLLEISDQAIQTFKNRKVNRKFAFFRFDINKILCHIQFNNYEMAEKIAERHFKEMTSGSLNWYVLKIYIMVGRLQSENYQGAYELLIEMRNDKGYSKLPETILQTLLVYEAHVEFLISINRIQANQPSKFRLHKFLNEIPLFTKDKRGLNIAILIVHVLFLLQQHKYTQIIDRVDALNQYCHRHLRRDDTFRSNCMIRMLLQIPRADFNRIRTERYAEPYLKKLNSMPLMISEQSIEVEIIPYENLWQMVIELLE